MNDKFGEEVKKIKEDFDQALAKHRALPPEEQQAADAHLPEYPKGDVVAVPYHKAKK